MRSKALHMVTFTLLVIGGINWLAVAILRAGIAALTDPISEFLTRIIYLLFGLAALFELALHMRTCRMCGKSAVSLASPDAPAPGGIW